MGSKTSNIDVKHIAKLANLNVTPEEEEIFSRQFKNTLKTVDQINELDTSKAEVTSQVTGLVNVTREDKIDESRLLKLSGYFKVPAIFDE